MRYNPNIQFDSTEYPSAWNFKNRAGERYGRLTIMSYAGKKSGQIYWKCRCDCGTTFATYGGNVVRGLTTSCGCVHSEVTAATATSHGETRRSTKSPEYACWVQIKTRCFNPNYIEFHLYGGRGITMCDRWRDSFEAFLEDMGRKPSKSHSIDRWPDVHGDYEPNNCRWATPAQQAGNRRPSGPRARDGYGRFASGDAA